MAVKQLQVRLKGVAPLICKNGQTADPLNPYSQAIAKITSKRKKTKADYEEVARLEFLASFYLHDNRPCLPPRVLKAIIASRGGAAGKERRRKDATAGIWVDNHAYIEYEGPTDPDEMWKDDRFHFTVPVVVKGSKIIRTRVIFPLPWAVEVTYNFNDRLVDERDLKRWLKVAGEEVGLCEWRPEYGRFEPEF